MQPRPQIFTFFSDKTSGLLNRKFSRSWHTARLVVSLAAQTGRHPSYLSNTANPGRKQEKNPALLLLEGAILRMPSDMYPVLIQFGPVTIYSFGAFMALAALTAAWVVHGELKRRHYNPELASSLVFAAAVGGLVGARLLFIVENWNNFVSAPMNYIFTGAGFTWYGGFLGGTLAVSWLVKRNGLAWLDGADIAAPALAVAYGIGRLGCHFAGDGDWGSVTDVPWGVAYVNAIIGWVDPNTGEPYPRGVRVHPTPLYEFASSAAIFAVLKILGAKNYAAGTIAWVYLILSGFARFMVEFWRINPTIAFGLSEAQLFSLALTAIGLGGLMMRSPRAVTASSRLR
jgi:phosphatidylglycerol:prolipoprotein diacylglycerol transferase